MNASEVTLTNYPDSPLPSKGQLHLLFKRSDPNNAMLYDEGNALRYYLATSDAFSKVKIRDEAQKVVVEVNRRAFLRDVFVLPNRNDGKPVKVADVLKQAATTSTGQLSWALHTEQGTYYWRRKRSELHWALYEPSSTAAVAWTETVSGTPPTWELVLESRALHVLDYVLAALFYLKAAPDNSEAGKAWEIVDSRVAALVTK
ncbi:hypothetical protein NP233_g4917 [Leucocoprinus birnbaumii]|uniref:DUF6593 domain-containing protein n=1 Tax=Leucocoprinus birnbaumii TaxID=56174 RepID=A0AAD5YV28_9AGAR|nr:hypothetical protein NP233_g4917 [Leucocoprinus birnbaumii]